MPMIHRRSDHNDASGESSPFLDNKKDMGNVARFYRISGLLCFVGLFMLVVTHSGTSSDTMGFGTAIVSKKSSAAAPSPMDNYPNLEAVFGKFERCVVSWARPPPKSEWDTKPLWFPSTLGSGSSSPANMGDIMKPLINGITGLKAGGKNYHASSKVLKRCKGLDETATCANGHPVTSVGPEKQTANFYPSVLLLIRNFRTAFPVSANDKAVAYHGAKAEMEPNAWRKLRDQWYKEGFNNWKSVIMTWKEMEAYDVGMYLQYEELMDPKRGPAAVQRIADLLQSAGFSVAPKEDLPCIWFNIVKKEYLRLKDYCQFNYGFTKEQRDFLLQELEAFQKEVADDIPLVAILKEYYDDIRENAYDVVR